MNDTNINLDKAYSLKRISFIASLLLIFLYWYTNISFFYLLGTITLIILFIKQPDIIGFGMLFALFPVENMTRFQDAPFSLVTLLICVLLIKLLLKKEVKLDLLTLLIGIAMMFLLSLYTILYGNMFDLDNLRFIINIVFITTLILLYKKRIIEHSFKISQFYILGAFLLLLFSVINSSFILNTDILSNRLYGLREDPNYVAVTFSIAISMCIINLYKKKANPFITITLISMFLIGIFLTQSRGGMISSIPNLVLLFFLLFKRDKKLKVTFIAFIIVTCFLVSKNSFLFDSIFNNLSDRINRVNTDNGSGRLDIWKAYIELYMNNVGQFLLGPSTVVAPQYGSGITVAHNIILGTIAKSGGINFLLIMIALGNIYRIVCNTSNVKNNTYIGSLPIITMSFGYFFLDAIFINTFIYIFLLSTMLVKTTIKYRVDDVTHEYSN